MGLKGWLKKYFLLVFLLSGNIEQIRKLYTVKGVKEKEEFICFTSDPNDFSEPWSVQKKHGSES